MFQILKFCIRDRHPFKALNGLELTFVSNKDITEKQKNLREVKTEEQLLELKNDHYSTMIIGKNGTGKSQVLKSIIDAFNYLISLKLKDEKKVAFYFDYDLKYQIDAVTYDCIYTKKGVEVSSNGTSFEVQDIPMPQKILVSSFNLNDKYPIFKKNNKPKSSNYEYLGVRAASNNAFISVNEKKIIQNIQKLLNDGKTDVIKKVFDSLEFAFSLTFVFKAGRRLQINKEGPGLMESYKTVEGLENYYAGFTRRSRDYRIDKYKKRLNLSDLQTAVDFLRQNEEIFEKRVKGKIRIRETIDLSIQGYENSLTTLLLLTDLDLLELQTIELYKSTGSFDFSSVSSGEYNLFANLINLVSNCDENSLVIIDEPEVSLHPNWQMEYMTLLRDVFQHFKGIHFVIATHSHFLLSNIFQSSSTIIVLGLSEDGLSIQRKYVDDNTYGWLTDEVLFYVFGVRSSRNKFFELEIQKLLSLVSNKSKDFAQIESSIAKLEPFELSELDPLNKIISISKQYIKSFKE